MQHSTRRYRLWPTHSLRKRKIPERSIDDGQIVGRGSRRWLADRERERESRGTGTGQRDRGQASKTDRQEGRSLPDGFAEKSASRRQGSASRKNARDPAWTGWIYSSHTNTHYSRHTVATPPSRRKRRTAVVWSVVPSRRRRDRRRAARSVADDGRRLKRRDVRRQRRRWILWVSGDCREFQRIRSQFNRALSCCSSSGYRSRPSLPPSSSFSRISGGRSPSSASFLRSTSSIQTCRFLSASIRCVVAPKLLRNREKVKKRDRGGGYCC